MRFTCGSNSGGHRRLVVLAPSRNALPRTLRNVQPHKSHRKILADLQRLRGRLYLQDGAISPWQLTADGRFRVDSDQRSWHILSVDRNENILGCARYCAHPRSADFNSLGVSRCPIALSQDLSRRFRWAVEEEMAHARMQGISYVEMGGWALAEEIRFTTEALRIALASYALADLLGGCIGISTATQRHASSSILRRIGGSPLGSGGYELPPYFDPQYMCQMEVLRFDSRVPNPRYAGLIGELTKDLAAAQVICPVEFEAGIEHDTVGIFSLARAVTEPAPATGSLMAQPA